ncbi:hypothetical protein AWB81_01817 [Caballeronia arationis]|uniref:hypothetical protein n=1 Tax=Caballeronia arationis TaxID=1777142 RepID=UPI00074C8121|nr:hypothetical protein [Caballeronia arationis]SAK59266.1 hypothetical protein AWB81_01817 [Caballeronia arationis]
MSLLPNELIETGEVFVASMQHVLANCMRMSEERYGKLSKFVYSMVLAEKPYMIASPKGVQHAIELVFEDEVIRDFVFTLGFTFLARWGGLGRYSELVQALAFAVSGDGNPVRGQESLVMMPAEIGDLLPDPEGVLTLLQQNKWLVTLLMIQLFVLVPEPPKASKRNVQDQARDTTNP